MSVCGYLGFLSSRRRHTRCLSDWSSDVCSSDLEAQEPGWGASGRNGGQVNPGLKFDPDVVEHDHGADLGRRMNALAGAAPTFVFDLIKRHAIQIGRAH